MAAEIAGAKPKISEEPKPTRRLHSLPWCDSFRTPLQIKCIQFFQRTSWSTLRIAANSRQVSKKYL